MEIKHAFILTVLGLLLYSNTWRGPFVFDDVNNIQNNANIHLTQLTIEKLIKAAFHSPCRHRPIPNISFALNYYFHKLDVRGYHAINILIHIASGMLLSIFFMHTLNLASPELNIRSVRWIAFAAACIWLVHPVQTQAVSYIVQRMTSMAAMFYLASLVCYVKFRRSEATIGKTTLLIGSALFGIAAIGSKEIAATLPFFILLYEWYFFRDLQITDSKYIAGALAASIVSLFIATFLFLGIDPIEKILSTYATRDFTLSERVLTQFRVVMFYLSLLLFPHPERLNLDHDFPLSHSLIEPLSTLFSGIALVGLIVFAVMIAKRERLMSFSIIWFLGNLVMESSVIGLEIIFEHRMYLPSMMGCLIAVSVMYRLIPKRWLSIEILCVVIVVFSSWTYTRNWVWADDLALWQDSVRKSPNKARPHISLGISLSRRDRLEEAITHYKEAIRIDEKDAMAHNLLGLVSDARDALEKYSKALEINPNYAEAHNNLAVAMGRLGKYREAIEHIELALKIKPEYVDAYNNLGNLWMGLGNTENAIECYRKALSIHPDEADVHNNLGVVLASQKKYQEAIHHFNYALQIKPDYEEAQNNMKITLQKLQGAD